MDGGELLRERSVLPYHYVQTALAASFCLIWAFIGITALIDRLGDARRHRHLHGVEAAHGLKPSKSRARRASKRSRRRTPGHVAQGI